VDSTLINIRQAKPTYKFKHKEIEFVK